MSINVLDQETVNKIAAGEVIERPSSVVKELLENAIDSGAVSVTVEIKDGGITLIRVTDSGCGINKNDVKTAFLRHATSKIKNADDLNHIISLGFRGEALSSIAAVAKVELITKTHEDLTGTRYCIEGGAETHFEEVGAPDGTTVIVRDLFYHTPARRKFLKSPSTEGAKIADLAEHIAMSHPEVSLRFIQNNKNMFQTSGNGSVKDIIYQIYGRNIASSLLAVEKVTESGIKIGGFLGKPEISRGSRALEEYYLNGRYIKSAVITKAIEEGYSGFLMQRQYPFTVLSFEVDLNQVDINVHPAKMDVRFADETLVYNEISAAVKDALHEKELIRDVVLNEESEKRKTFGSSKDSGDEKKSNKHCTEKPAEPFELKRIENEKGHEISRVKREEDSDKKKEYFNDAGSLDPKLKVSEQLSFLSEESKKSTRIIGQVFDTYWLAEFDEALYIIDQHAAHEKVMYERLLKRMHEGKIVSQPLLVPIILTLTASEQDLLERNSSMFHNAGYDLENFGGKEYAVRAVPDMVPSVVKEEMIKEWIGSLCDYSKEITPEILLEKTASLACKAAVKGNSRLSSGEAGTLIDELLHLDNPYNCPHGRPTIIRVSKTEVEKKFKRIV